MSLSILKLVSSHSPPAAVPSGSTVKSTAVTSAHRSSLLSVQVKCLVEDQNARLVKAPTKFSRRDMALCLSAATCASVTSLSLPQTSEARVVKSEVRKKIFEKLQMLRDKAGLSKPKAENGEKTAPPQPSIEDLKLMPPIPLPNPKSDGTTSVIEVTMDDK